MSAPFERNAAVGAAATNDVVLAPGTAGRRPEAPSGEAASQAAQPGVSPAKGGGAGRRSGDGPVSGPAEGARRSGA